MAKESFTPSKDTPSKVPAVRTISRDSGRRWISDLDPPAKDDLFEFGGRLFELMKKNPRIKHGRFFRILRDSGEDHPALQAIRSITRKPVDIYYVYWAYCYAHLYAHYVRRGRRVNGLHETVCEDMRARDADASRILHRLDVSSMTSIFMERQVKDTKGLVMMTNLQKALDGETGAIKTYLEESREYQEERVAIPFDPENLSESELRERVVDMRKKLGRKHVDERLSG